MHERREVNKMKKIRIYFGILIIISCLYNFINLFMKCSLELPPKDRETIRRLKDHVVWRNTSSEWTKSGHYKSAHKANENILFSKILYKDISAVSQNVSNYICPDFNNRLGNQMFQFASAYGIARLNNMSVFVGSDDIVAQIFKLNVEIRKNRLVCRRMQVLQERKACTFDESLVSIDNNKDYRIARYLQSWKYFIHAENSLRKQFVFKSHIISVARYVLLNTLQKMNKSRTDVTLIGIHVRRGDMARSSSGYKLATPEYFERAMRYYNSQYKNVVFLVCSKYIAWCEDNIKTHIGHIEFISPNEPEVDLAILASCDHVIQSVGSFSWWAAWLSGGTSVFYKWPAIEGSFIRSLFSSDYSDYFYPGWMGM